MSKIIGIDLGTTHSRVAVMEGGVPTVIVNEMGLRAIPSMVSFNGNNRYVTGQYAKNQAVSRADRTVSSIKRRIGTGFSVSIDGASFTATEISALLLKKMKAMAENYLGETVTDAVITVPACFTNAQRLATIDAGRIAGLNVARIINEPTAAVLGCGLNHSETQKVLAYDLGGGSFDVSLVEVGNGIFEVLATAGDDQLGGDDFDQRIVDYMAEDFKRKNGIDLRRDPMALQRLKDAVEKAKIELSGQMSANISLMFIAADATGPKHLNMTLTRQKFDELTADLVEKTIDSLNRVMSDAGISAREIDKVILVGGASRIPAVREAVQRATGKEPVGRVNPDECAVMGAAIQGGVLNGECRDIVLLDATAHSLGIEAVGGAFVKMIDRNTTVPCLRKQIFTTSQDRQTSVDVHVLQGESERAAENKTLTKYRVDGIAPAAKGVSKVEVTFEVDTNGIAHVSSKILEKAAPQPVPEQPKVEPKAAEIKPDRMEKTGGAGLTDEDRRVIESMLPTIDNLERALSMAKPGDPMAQGIEMTLKTMLDNLSKYGLEEIPALGEYFDPYKHNAVASERRGEPGRVLEVFQKGYRVKDKVIRYAMVKVSVE